MSREIKTAMKMQFRKAKMGFEDELYLAKSLLAKERERITQLSHFGNETSEHLEHDVAKGRRRKRL